MATSERPLVLVTGANGFIAARTIEAFLIGGYNVRGTVRSENSGKAIQEVLADYVKAGQFSIFIVPDITKTGAFDEAVKGVHAIAHLAAPVSLSFKDPVPVMHGAIQGTKTLLDSAYAFGGEDLKTVVLCSSIVAVTSPREKGHVYSEKDWNEASEANVEKLGAGATSMDIYSASKTAAEKAFWAFRDAKHPSFTMSAINPCLVGGPPLVLTKPEDINETVVNVWKVFSGAELPPTTGTGTIVDVRDVARMFVFTVDHPEVAKNERYLVVGGAGPTQAVADVLREGYPNRRDIIKEGTPGAGYRPDFDISWLIDHSKAEKATGQKMIGFKESVLAAAKAFEKFI